jgi:hypothetical protein
MLRVLSSRSLRTFPSCLLPPSSERPDDTGLVYGTKVDRTSALFRRIFAAAECMRNHPENIDEATQSLLMRAEKCIEFQGGHFGQLL